MWSTCLRTSCSKAVRDTLGGGLRDCRSCFRHALELGEQLNFTYISGLGRWNAHWQHDTTRATFSSSCLGLQFEAMHTTRSGPIQSAIANRKSCVLDCLCTRALSLSLFHAFVPTWENDGQHFQTSDRCCPPCPFCTLPTHYIDIHRHTQTIMVTMINQPISTHGLLIWGVDGGSILVANAHLLGYPLLINHGLINHGLTLYNMMHIYI